MGSVADCAPIAIARQLVSSSQFHRHAAACVAACFHDVVAPDILKGAAFVLLRQGLSNEGSPEAEYFGCTLSCAVSP